MVGDGEVADVGHGMETDVSIVTSELLPSPTSTEAFYLLCKHCKGTEYSGLKDYQEFHALETDIECTIILKMKHTKPTDFLYHYYFHQNIYYTDFSTGSVK